jgi:transmembrane sensor
MNQDLNENSADQGQDAFRVGYLITGYIQNTLTEPERDELDEWVTASDENMRLFAELTDEKNIEQGLKERGLYNADKAVELLKTKVDAKRKKQRAKTRELFAYGIAACLILLAGLFLVVPLFEKKNTRPATHMAQNDLLPGGDKAILTLSNGQRILLDTAGKHILQEGGLSVVNLDGKISYEGKTNEVNYHTLSTPEGGQYKLALPDGTEVWLNAASSLKYPIAFAGTERIVELTGEAYFEVAKDKSKAFKVKLKNEAVIEVLGTHFNIMAYDDEAYVKTTLLEGAVKVKGKADTVTLAPGQQAALGPGGQITLPKNIDTDRVVAWKNGLFEFKDEPIESIMRQVARWYGVTVKYEGKVTEHFNASIERKVPVSKLFHLLEITDRVHFTIQDKTIIVKP